MFPNLFNVLTNDLDDFVGEEKVIKSRVSSRMHKTTADAITNWATEVKVDLNMWIFFAKSNSEPRRLKTV